MKPLYTIALLCAIASCNKDKLNIKPNQALVIPQTVADYQSLVDNSQKMNTGVYPYLGELSSDNYYTPYTTWNGFANMFKYSYIWAKDPFLGGSVPDWTSTYSITYYANIVLNGMGSLPAGQDQKAFNNALGCAYFYRAMTFWQIAQLFCKPYNASTASSDVGIVLRTGTDPLVQVPRASVQQTYDQILSDINRSKDLIDSVSSFVYPTRPALPAVYALLSRVYMSMRIYDKALDAASKSLGLYNNLLDYNSLLPSNYPFTAYNKEVIWEAQMIGSSTFNSQSACPVDTTLYSSYDDNDLRKSLFYSKSATTGRLLFKGTYSGGSFANFCGLAVDELYLNRAECYARAGDITNSMKDLNTLMRTRWKNNGTYIDFTATDPADALTKVLTERRKELVYRGIRWMDLRRLNLEGANITLTRNLNGTIYMLKPNSLNYVFPIPKQETDYNPVSQNERE